jgi:hypothetical protein
MQSPTGGTSDEFVQVRAVASTTVFTMILSIFSMLLCWSMFFIAPINFCAGLISCIAVSTFGLGGHSTPGQTVSTVAKLKKSDGCCCPGSPGRHVHNLFVAAAVLAGMAFLGNLVGGVVWVQCERAWDDWDDYYYGGWYDNYGHEWADEPCENYAFFAVTEFRPAVQADVNEEGKDYSSALCTDHVSDPKLRTALHDMWLGENPEIQEETEDYDCTQFPTSWEASDHFSTFKEYDELAREHNEYSECQSIVKHLYLVTNMTSCHGDGDECSDSVLKQKECEDAFYELPRNSEGHSAYSECYDPMYEEHSDIVGCVVRCYFFPQPSECEWGEDEGCNSDEFVPGNITDLGLKKFYGYEGEGFKITVTKGEEYWYDDGGNDIGWSNDYYYERRDSCERPTREGVFAYACLVSAVVNGLLLVLNCLNAHRMGKISGKMSQVVHTTQGIEMGNMRNMSVADGEVVFRADGYAGGQVPTQARLDVGGNGLLQVMQQQPVLRPTVDMTMVGGGTVVSGGSMDPQQQQMYQQQMILQRLNSQSLEIERQRLQIQRNEHEMRLAGAMQARSAVAFNLDGTIASLPEATAILQDAAHTK